MVRDAWLNLNGEWEFELDPGRSGDARGLPLDDAYGRRIVVPFAPESKLSGIEEKDFMPCVWYRRRFRIPAEWQRKRVLAHFGAVDYDAMVWVNGKQLGGHRGGYTPFCLDITDALRGDDNVLAVRAVDDTRSPLQPTGKQSRQYDSYGCLYTRTTGIWQTVWLEPVPETHLQRLRLTTADAGTTVLIQADAAGPAGDLRLSARVLAEGAEVGAGSAPLSSRTVLSVPVRDVRLWEPGSPYLYDVELTLSRPDGTSVDAVRSFHGARTISIDGKRILLNGKPIFQRLVLDQGFHPDGVYTAPSDEALRQDIELSMAMGFNGARLHEKVFEPRFLYWADRLGYLVWGEYPNWGLDHGDPAALERVLPEWLEAVDRDASHPAIVGWCPFNETPGSQNPELLRTVYRATKASDPTRPVVDTSGYVHVETDIYDCHNYTQDPAQLAASFEPFKTSEEVWHNNAEADAPYRGQPYFVSEYGGIWWNPGQTDRKAWGYGDRPGSAEEFLTRYRALTETLLFHPKMFGFCYTQLYDIEQEVNGLYTYDRKPKFDPEVIRQINAQQAAIERAGR